MTTRMDSNRQSLPLKSFRSIARVGGSGQSAGLERCAHTTEVDNSIGAVEVLWGYGGGERGLP